MSQAKASSRTSHIQDNLEQQNAAERWLNGKSIKSKLCTDFDENSEYADLAEKILQNVNSTFERDDLIDEFDIVPAESKANHSPLIHAAAEHKLALESWCIPYLYTHSYKSFFAIRRKQKCSTSLSSSNNGIPPSKYGSLRASKLSESDRVSRGLLLSRILTLLNPDLTAAWNFRREYIPITSNQVFERELRFVSIVATRKPKCPEGFSYRRWLVDQAFNNHLLALEVISEWILNETTSIEIPSNRYFSNYHAWSYRLWLIQKVLNDDAIPLNQKRLVLEVELKFSDKWINTHVSDYCGHHYMQKMLQLTMAENNVGIVPKLKKELDENAKRIVMYKCHETLWFHRRAMMKMLVQAIQNESKGGDPSNFLKSNLEDNEKKFIASTQQDNIEFCKKYVIYLNAQFEFKCSS